MVCCKCCQGFSLLCRVFTHGWLIAAVVLSCFAVGSCEFVTRDNLTIGLFRVQRPGSECVAYRDLGDLTYGWLYDWARICGLLAPLSGGLVVALMILDCCCKVCCSKYMQTFLVVCCQLNQGFTFLIYASDACISRKGVDSDNLLALCRVGDGSILSLFAIMCYFIGGFFLCCSPKPDPACCHKDDDNDGKKCCRKEKKEKKSEDVHTKSEEKPAVQENKPKEEDPVVAPVILKKEEEKEEEPVQLQQTKDAEQTKEEDKTEEARAVPDEEEPGERVVADEEAPEEEEEDVVPDDEEEEVPDEGEAPAIVPVPVVIPAVAPRSHTPQPEDSCMEIEFDEEFGTSQIRDCFNMC